MKKLFIPLIMLLVCTFTIIGCAEPAPAPAPAPTPAPEPAPAPAAEKPIELKFSSWHPPMALPATAMTDPWCEKINELSGGRVNITVYHGGTLGALSDHYQMVLSRQADIVISGGTEGIHVLSTFSTLPFMFTSAEMTGVIHHQLALKYLADTELKDVKILWFVAGPPDRLCSNVRLVKTMADLKGQKIATGSDIGLNTLRALGATPTFLPPTEIYTALERGLVDGETANWEKYLVFGDLEVTKYHTNVALWDNVMPTYMNWDAYNSLPPDIQQIIDENSGVEYTRFCERIFDDNDLESRGKVQEYLDSIGSPPIYDLPEDEVAKWQEAAQVVHEDWVKDLEEKGLGAEAKALLTEAKALAKEFK
jgi:TRAP-type C4-dicarboxylate transport system substrate-binding protein